MIFSFPVQPCFFILKVFITVSHSPPFPTSAPTEKPTSVGVDISDELLADFFMKKLQLEGKKEGPQPPKALEDLTLSGVAKLIQKIQSSEDSAYTLVDMYC